MAEQPKGGGGPGCLGCLGFLGLFVVVVLAGPILMAFFPFATTAPAASASNHGGLHWPVRGTLTDRFGWRYAPEDGHKEYHTGLDIAAPLGTPVRAVAAGRVIFADWSGRYGYLIEIDHGDGWQSWYAHLAQIKVVEGQNVEAGEMIGLVGSTGRSTGPHLHLEIWAPGGLVDPESVLP